ncbi:porin [Sulfuricella sp.]|uniref:porin n=1 Tax=Sulfuricella sp. TaxID=2099377 RepID=UPI002B8A6EC3|nr:porin [Sulfuricella sp.]HUX62603.1 porin [Sulfuricella sp.]
MNKKLIALAVAAALAPAAAMADSGNVSIYGILDASIDVTDNGDTADGTKQGIRTHKVSSNSSRIGFKGNEDLGNGLAAVWQIETALNVDGGATTGGTTLGSRNTFVGLSSKTAGTVILGRHDTPYKLATRGLDYFTDGLADNRNIMGGGGATSTTAGPVAGSALSFDGRQSDVVAYISPTFSGFHAAVAYVAGAELVTTSGQQKGNAWSAMGMYDNGPLMASLAYERHKVGDANTGDAGPSWVGAGSVNRSEKAWKLGVGYKIIDALQVGFAFEKTSDDLNAGTEVFGHKAWTLGGKYSMGSNDLKLAFTKAGDQGSTSDTGAKQWALGVDHNMSKRTKVYAQYVKLNNDKNAFYGLNGAGATGSVSAIGASTLAGGADPSAWSFGMRHSF